jgi:hypothetical protein
MPKESVMECLRRRGGKCSAPSDAKGWMSAVMAHNKNPNHIANDAK